MRSCHAVAGEGGHVIKAEFSPSTSCGPEILGVPAGIGSIGRVFTPIFTAEAAI
jgi:hypothetical protein